MSKTVEQLLDGVNVEGVNEMVAKKRGEQIPKVLDGLQPKRPPTKEGLQRLTPEQLLALRVDAIRVNGRVVGYQRELDLTHSRKVAAWLRDGKPLPTLEVALDGHGAMWLVDGQHRAAGAVMARRPVEVFVRRLTKEERAELFFSQRRAKNVDPNVLVLSGDTPFERYVQEAVSTRDHSHPWYGIVSPSRSSKSRIGPYALYQLLVRYIGNLEGGNVGGRGQFLTERWDRGLADDLASLIRCFGTKATNPLAFRPVALHAIGATAMWIFRRGPEHPENRERWLRHMPTFPFDMWPHLRTQRQLTEQLLAHWNKGLRGKRRVERPE